MHDALGELDEALARMYLGALLALRQTENPDRLALAAHDMRELMEKLARHNNNTEGDGQLVTTTMMQQARMLDADWRTSAQRSKCHQGGRWEGEIDDPLRKGLGAVRRFLDWVDAMRRGPSELYSVQHPHEQSTKSFRQNPSKLYHVASQTRETVACDAGLHDAEGNRSRGPAIPPHKDRSPYAAHPSHRFLIVD